jgi:hypothetical protein
VVDFGGNHRLLWRLKEAYHTLFILCFVFWPQRYEKEMNYASYVHRFFWSNRIMAGAV